MFPSHREGEKREGRWGGRREASFGGFPTPVWALGSRGGKYLPLGGRVGHGRGLPVAGLELVELVEFEADVLDGELQQVPEACQVLGCGPQVGVHILKGGRKEKMGEKERCGKVEENKEIVKREDVRRAEREKRREA